jgi:hypothetical protein
MALVMRFRPAAGITALSANGRSYSVGAAATVDVPYLDGQAIGPDQATFLMFVGATADRPANITSVANWPPLAMFDTTLNKPIFLVRGSAPASWTDITGVAA